MIKNMDIKPIKTEADYLTTLKIIATLMHAKANSTEGDMLEVLSLLVHEYEHKNHRVEKLSPLEAIKYEMNEQSLSQSGLAKRFGMSKSAISEILAGKKQMSVRFMKFLYHDLGIPADILLN
jgi:HTH-type transcriptional regulator/antitoxin HigA